MGLADFGSSNSNGWPTGPVSLNRVPEVTLSNGAPRGLLLDPSQSARSCLRYLGPCSAFTATGSTALILGEMPVLHSLRSNRPTSLRLTATTSIALLDTLTRLYSARPRCSRGSSSRGSCRGARVDPWRRVLGSASSSPRTHERRRNSGGFLWI